MTDISLPQIGDEVRATHPSQDTLSMLAQRRSTVAALLQEPGPTGDQLEMLLQVASRVPDHRKVVPFRYVVFEGEARKQFGDKMVEASQLSKDPEMTMSEETVRGLFLRAPVVVAVISSLDHEHKTPEWEQILTAGAVCYNLLLAASAAGYAGQWLSEWVAYDPHIYKAMGLEANEKIAGLIYLGTAEANPKERARPEALSLTTKWSSTD